MKMNTHLHSFSQIKRINKNDHLKKKTFKVKFKHEHARTHARTHAHTHTHTHTQLAFTHIHSIVLARQQVYDSQERG